MKVTTVELTDMTDSASKEEQVEIEEQDTATAVDNICYERVPSKSNIWHQVWWLVLVVPQWLLPLYNPVLYGYTTL